MNKIRVGYSRACSNKSKQPYTPYDILIQLQTMQLISFMTLQHLVRFLHQTTRQSILSPFNSAPFCFWLWKFKQSAHKLITKASKIFWIFQKSNFIFYFTWQIMVGWTNTHQKQFSWTVWIYNSILWRQESGRLWALTIKSKMVRNWSGSVHLFM